ncbi:hypothetical protein [Prochlorococcus marinus]|uniref:hypothetical protein n=1 Tax=Prochlorococcus marinus TaxID=1219 RepID=UPI0022B434A8|nr:hypothetical protein [Prochlorococcus marinus]|tara:strand:- start:367 stop:588 length:222 start_codon:yes stop_codon:yes gene_type:complete
MAIATFTEASNLLGYKSRSTLYKLKKDGLLDDYLIEIKGRSHLILKPVGKPRLEDYLLQILQWRPNGVLCKHY